MRCFASWEELIQNVSIVTAGSISLHPSVTSGICDTRDAVISPTQPARIFKTDFNALEHAGYTGIDELVRHCDIDTTHGRESGGLPRGISRPKECLSSAREG